MKRAKCYQAYCKRKKFSIIKVRTKDCTFVTKNYKCTTAITLYLSVKKVTRYEKGKILYAYTYHDSAWPGTSTSDITLTPKLE